MSVDLDEAYKYCPQCHVETKKTVVTYTKPQHGIFRTNLSRRIRVTEITYECPKCGWSYWMIKEEEE